jgi:hypothetical protein
MGLDCDRQGPRVRILDMPSNRGIGIQQLLQGLDVRPGLELEPRKGLEE